MNEPITIDTHVQAPLEKVWRDYNDPKAMEVWATADESWHTINATNDLREGGNFSYRMEAKDGSEGFDLVGTYDAVVEHERIAYTMNDGRKVTTTFMPTDNGVHIVTQFEPETINTHEVQQAGWQAILNNFKKYTEGAS